MCGSKHLTWCEHAHKAISMVFKCTTTGRGVGLPPKRGGVLHLSHMNVRLCVCVCVQLVGNLFKYRHAVGNAMPTGISCQVKHISAKIKRNSSSNSNNASPFSILSSPFPFIPILSSPIADCRLRPGHSCVYVWYGIQIAVISFNLSQRQQRQRQQQMLPLAAQIVFVWEIETSPLTSRSLCKMRIKKWCCVQCPQRLLRQYKVAHLLYSPHLHFHHHPLSHSPYASYAHQLRQLPSVCANAQLLFV